MIIVEFPVIAQELIQRIRQGDDINYVELMGKDVMKPGDWVVDPRPTEFQELKWRFNFVCGDGNTVILQSITDTIEGDIDYEHFDFGTMCFRAYDTSSEAVPHFGNEASAYMYWGLSGEYAPRNITMGRVHSTATIIGDSAFKNCKRTEECDMEGSNVRQINDFAFEICSSMVRCKLSMILITIDEYAFLRCKSIVSMNLPSTVTGIWDGAFAYCSNMKILGLPEDVFINAEGVVMGCSHILGNAMRYQLDEMNGFGAASNNNEVNIWLQQCNDDVPLFHRICQDPQVSADTITTYVSSIGRNAASEAVRQDRNGNLPLHSLYFNPHSDLFSVVRCIRVNPVAMLSSNAMFGVGVNFAVMHIRAHSSPRLLLHELCAYNGASEHMIRNWGQPLSHQSLEPFPPLFGDLGFMWQVGWVPLQLLIFNPNVTPPAIGACCNLNPEAAFVRD